MSFQVSTVISFTSIELMLRTLIDGISEYFSAPEDSDDISVVAGLCDDVDPSSSSFSASISPAKTSRPGYFYGSSNLRFDNAVMNDVAGNSVTININGGNVRVTIVNPSRQTLASGLTGTAQNVKSSRASRDHSPVERSGPPCTVLSIRPTHPMTSSATVGISSRSQIDNIASTLRAQTSSSRGVELFSFQKVFSAFETAISQFRKNSPLAVAFSPDSADKVASGLSNGVVRISSISSGHAPYALKGHAAAVSCVAFAPNRRLLVSGSDDYTLRIWGLASTRGAAAQLCLRGHTGKITSVAFSPCGMRITSGSTDTTIRVWDVRTGQEALPPFVGHSRGVTTVAFSPDGRRLASGSHDCTIRIWNAATGETTLTIREVCEAFVYQVLFMPDGDRLLSCSTNTIIQVWDARTGNVVMEPLRGHKDSVRAVAITPDGMQIVSGSNDKTVRIWDSWSGQQVGFPLTGHTECVRSVSVSSDGTRIVSASYDGSVRLWDLATGRLLDVLQDV
ncbi:hypothetical protein HGRIS_013898 [Hohenbuehelia grisea]|uniref:WD40 repeat-like protein n=1 Tax=Hohenbuehelia grisea TaxID=104357 RepID=A0ABR3IX95_9AGAR